MYEPVIRFNGEQYQGLEKHLGDLAEKLVGIVNATAFNRLKENALRDPTDIEVTPVMLERPSFIVRSWHETESPEGSVGILQPQELTLEVKMDKEDMYLTTEEDSSYRLTTREAFLMVTIGGAAMLAGILSDPTIGE